MTQSRSDRFAEIATKLNRGCLVYTVDAATGEREIMTQEEYIAALRTSSNLIPHVDPMTAQAHAEAIKRQLERARGAS